MPDDLGWDSFDRRHFMVTAIGASAVLATSTDPASAQASTTSRGTVYTGDMIDGKKVISALNIDDLESGKKHLFYFQGVETTTGQHWHVSTIVAKGTRPGKRIALVSGVHGDEISTIRTIQTVVDRLNPAEMSGAVLAVLDVSRPAMEGMARRWPNSGRGIDLIDLNRECGLAEDEQCAQAVPEGRTRRNPRRWQGSRTCPKPGRWCCPASPRLSRHFGCISLRVMQFFIDVGK